jgi:hypothetical protein
LRQLRVRRRGQSARSSAKNPATRRRSKLQSQRQLNSSMGKRSRYW